MKNTIHIDHGTEANTAHDIHYMDVMVIKDTQAVDQRYTRIGLIILGLIDIKQNHEQKTENIRRSHEAHPKNKTALDRNPL